MARGEISIDESLCKGCALCVEFCSHGCIGLVPGKVSAGGMPVAAFISEDNCTACCVCAWMCPDFAIEVFKHIEVDVHA